LTAGEVSFFGEFDLATEWHARQVLLRGALRAPSLAPQLDHISAEPRIHPQRADS
jgi:hypothetical protein